VVYVFSFQMLDILWRLMVSYIALQDDLMKGGVRIMQIKQVGQVPTCVVRVRPPR
jgi:hypothetical protein